jgi:N-acyl-D-aspartate/D-glutamate deacylase
MQEFTLVIRNGTVVDGTGMQPRIADVGLVGDRIASIGLNLPTGCEEIDASGAIVTPGFVDIHSHYDGQVTWSSSLAPSSSHGVTTVIMGNCGIGFAPCLPEHRTKLIELMEGVEDIPQAVMAAGIPWTWVTFPEYLGALSAVDYEIDVAAQIPHCALRVYVMGQRGIERQPANADDIGRMVTLTREALKAGALGLATSRTVVHRAPDGSLIPSHDVAEDELHALAGALAAEDCGVLQVAMDLEDATAEANFAMLKRLVERSGRPLSFSLVQPLNQPDVWRIILIRLGEATTQGLPMRAQVFGRPVGMLLGLDLSFHPFSLAPAYIEIANLPLEKRVVEMARPERRARILGEPLTNAMTPFLAHLARFEWMFDLGDPPDYAPALSRSMAALAATRGCTPQEATYDFLLSQGGRAILLLPRANYGDGTLNATLAMLKHPATVLGLGDGGAHCGVICDASLPTFMLTYWARDRKADGLPLAWVVRALSAEPAAAVGLLDRGLIAPGYKADLNVIDLERLSLDAPQMVTDLPAGGRRLLQPARGYRATIVSGCVTRRDDKPTGALPGRLVRGHQSEPRI